LQLFMNDLDVICPGNLIEEARAVAEEAIDVRVSNLKELGMIVNEDKTEVICFSKLKDPVVLDLNCAGRVVTSKSTLKALGVTIDHRLR